MIDAMVDALVLLFSWPTVGFLVVGTIIGLLLGAIPGLGGFTGIAVMIPLTFGMDSRNAMALFGSMLGGSAFGGSITAILLNVPGTGPNMATLLDGHPMAKLGRAGEALGVSATASALGAIFGLVVLVLMIPVAQSVILLFGSPEFFWLAIVGLTVVVVTSQGRLLKGLIAGGFGFMISFFGYAPVSGEVRYAFGTDYLWDGIPLIPVLLGLFAIAEAIRYGVDRGRIAKSENIVAGTEGVLRGVVLVLRSPRVLLQSSAIGTVVGMIPGVGGMVANFVSYMATVQSSDDPDSFGHGNPQGVIASEASNDAKDGGTLLPTVVFGIPGSATTAVLLGALILHGLSPGQTILNDRLNVLFVLIFALLFSNILTSLIGLSTSSLLVRLTRIPTGLIVPVILVTTLIGAYVLRASIGDVVVTFLFGIVGYVMLRYDYSRIATTLAIILGPTAETAFFQSIQISGGSYAIFFKPISSVLVLIALISLTVPFVRSYRRDATSDRALDDSQSDGDSTSADNETAGASGWLETLLSVDKAVVEKLLAVGMLTFFVVLLVESIGYGRRTNLFPFLIGVPIVGLLFLLIGMQVSPRLSAVGARYANASSFDLGGEFADSLERGGVQDIRAARKRTIRIVAWVLGLFVLFYLFGVSIGTLAFLLAFYRFEAGIPNRNAVVYSFLIWAILVTIFTQLVSSSLYRGIFGVSFGIL